MRDNQEFEEWWEIRLIHNLGDFGNQMKEFRLGKAKNRSKVEQQLSLAHRNNMIEAEFENQSSHGKQIGLAERSKWEATIAS